MLDSILNFYQENQSYIWVVQIFIIVLVTLFAGYLVNKFVRRLEEKCKRTKNFWDDSFASAVRLPAKAMVWIVGLTFAVELIYQKSGADILAAVEPLRHVLVIAVIAWFVNRFIKNAQKNIISDRISKGQEIDQTTVDAVSQILRAAVIITAALVTLQTLGFSVSGVLAFGGIGGIAIGFAAKDLLANFFGALMIYFDRPFAVGEWIRSPDRDIEGTVEEIGWRQTRIRTFDKRPLYVPNSVFATIAVENPARMSNRRFYETIGVRYDDMGRVDKITQQVKEMIEASDYIDQSQIVMVNVSEFAASSVNFFVYCFTKTTSWAEFNAIKHELMLEIANIIENNKAEIAFPTRTLHMPDGISVAGDKGVSK